jgi:hypothetical protein
MPMIDKADARWHARERNEGRGAAHALQIAELGAARGVTPTDLFLSLAAMVMRQNPNLGAKLLNALELSVRQRPEVEVLGGPLGNVTETATPTVTVTEPESYCGPFDDACRAPEDCRALGDCSRLVDALNGKKDAAALDVSAVVTPPADVAFDSDRASA